MTLVRGNDYFCDLCKEPMTVEESCWVRVERRVDDGSLKVDICRQCFDGSFTSWLATFDAKPRLIRF